MKKVLAVSLVSVSAVMFISCGKGNANDGTSSGTGGGQTNAQDLFNSSAYKGPYGAFNKLWQADGGKIFGSSGSNPAPHLLPSTLSAQSSNYNCTTDSVTGNQTDADGDGIPVNITYEFECTSSDNGSTTQTSGKVQIKDQDDSDPESGFAICTGTIQGNTCSRSPITSTTTSSSGSVNTKLTMDVNIVKNGTTYTYNSFYFKLILGSFLDLTLDASGMSYKQDTAGDWENGTINGTMTLTVGSGGSTESFSVTYTDLHVSSSCDTADDGTAVWTRNSTCPSNDDIKDLTVNYTGCNTGTYSYTKCDGTTKSGSF